MGYNKKKQLLADKNKIQTRIIHEILEELRFLTGLSFVKLIGQLKKIEQNNFKIPERGFTTASLYRNAKEKSANAFKKVGNLKGSDVSTLKRHEGQLRIRI